MKKIFALASVALLLTSCAISNNTANTANFKSGIYTATVADLEVMPERVTYTYNTTKKVRRAGAENVRHAAEQELLATKAPGYDMILEPTYVVEKTNFLFRSRIDRVTVSGRPAKYKNPRTLNDSVWCNKNFRRNFQDQVDRSSVPGSKGLLRRLFGKKK